MAAPGTPLADGARVVGSWRGVAVLARGYPVAKGGPLGWEIQLAEMAQCAAQLASGTGLLALRPHPGGGGGSNILFYSFLSLIFDIHRL